MPRDRTLKAMNRIHRGVLRLSGGRLGWMLSGMPALELTTTGRRSGRRHTVLLTSPLQEEGRLVVVASRGGDDEPPAWLLNLQADPAVAVALRGGPSRPMRARVATPGERADLWPRITTNHPNYAAYQRRTNREIALVVLEPTPD